MAGQRITPMLSYEDGAAAIAWLCEAFGFEEVFRLADDDGRIGHAELRLEGACVFLAAPTPEYRSPRHVAETCEDVRRYREVPYVIDGVHVVVHERHRVLTGLGSEDVLERDDELVRVVAVDGALHLDVQ